MKNLKNPLITFLIGIVFATVALSYSQEHLVLVAGDKLKVYGVNADKGKWTYRLSKTVGEGRFSIISDRPLGYSNGDTLTFFGRIPKCYTAPSYKQKSKFYTDGFAEDFYRPKEQNRRISTLR